ncbi:MAG: hypothetical protein RBU21_16160 [FCB group bacterium]|jgi:pimeloyl-ACP methyl ester carboxylesterase|nr:hypothetical protein [FCB group bacterium]
MNVKQATLAIFLAVFLGCARATSLSLPDLSFLQSPGTIISVERIAGYNAPVFKTILVWSPLRDDMRVKCGAVLYRVHYWTTGTDGKPTPVSGLVSLPKQHEIRGVVAYHHGTLTERRKAPSKPSAEGVLVSAVFAGGGYLTVAPDYIGLGASDELHPYIHAESEANAARDLLTAAKAFTRVIGKRWPDSIYLVGFSQGGHATMATHRFLESLNDPHMQVKASAPVSGVYDLANLTFPTLLAGPTEGDSMYLAYLYTAYASNYNQPLSDIVAEPYVDILPTLFDGEHSERSIIDALPRMPREMLIPQFLDAYDDGRPTWFLTALAENEVINWTPKAPVRAYYGERDIDVSPEEARALVQTFTGRGADAQAISVGNYDHGGSVMQAIPRARAWFDALSKSNSP